MLGKESTCKDSIEEDLELGLGPAFEGGPDALSTLIRLAIEADAPGIAEHAAALAERIAEGRFYVACVGQFKRGKSTLLNALVGESLLPTGVVPVTTVVTVLRYGSHRGARVRFATGGWRGIDPTVLAEYVSEEQNPQNAKGVIAVEVFVPGPLLASGMCLVDTPGIGSVFAGNTAVTREFVPHIDAALVVLGADPPISGEELALVEEVARHVRDLIFVLSKADRLSEAERREASAFAERVVEQRLGRPIGPIFEVSAVEQLASGNAVRDWDTLYSALQTLAQQAGRDLVRTAQERGMTLLINRLLHELEEQHGALLRPVEESESRINTLRQCVAEAERSLKDLGYLFTAEQEELSKHFAERRERFLSQALPAAKKELNDALARAAATQKGPALRKSALLLAKEIAQRMLDAWLRAEQPLAEEAYGRVAGRFIALANDFLARLANSGEPGLAELPREIGPETGFRTRSRLYYHLDDPGGLADPTDLWRWLTDLLRPRTSMRRAARQVANAYLEDLLRRNSIRVDNDFEERVIESRRRLEAEIRDHLQEVSASAERALERARARHAAGAQAVQAELDRIDALRRQAIPLYPTRMEGAHA